MTDKGAEQARKAYGDNLLVKAIDARALNLPRISSGIYPVDRGLGGGYTTGRWHIVYGPKSGGKTYTALHTIKTVQNSCNKCWEYLEFCSCGGGKPGVAVYLSTESDWEPDWANDVGVDLDALYFGEMEFGEKGLDIADLVIRGGGADLVVIDSLAFLTPSKEIEDSVGKDHMGVQARMLGKGTRKIISGIMAVGRETGKQPTILCTNQVRINLQVMFGNPEVTPGGHAPQFAAVSMMRTRSKPVHNKALGRPSHADVFFKVDKNKTAPPHGEGSYRIMFANGEHKRFGDMADEHEMLADAKRLGLAVKEKGWQCMGETFKKQEELQKRLESDPLYKREVRRALLELHKVRREEEVPY
jgi:recombination protein RecA